MTILYLVPSIMYPDQIFYILGIFASLQRIVARTCMLFGGGGFEVVKYLFFCHESLAYNTIHLFTCRFLRSVAYRQFTRLLWDHLGSSKRYPLPCCAYSEIRKQFPSEDGNYCGFEDENTDS